MSVTTTESLAASERHHGSPRPIQAKPTFHFPHIDDPEIAAYTVGAMVRSRNVPASAPVKGKKGVIVVFSRECTSARRAALAAELAQYYTLSHETIDTLTSAMMIPHDLEYLKDKFFSHSWWRRSN